jgi:hypothetical protein
MVTVKFFNETKRNFFAYLKISPSDEEKPKIDKVNEKTW